MVRRAARGARFSRQWWPELLCAAILAAIGFAGQRDDPLFAIFEGLIVGVAWAMGHRHRTLPLHRKVDGLTDGVRDLIDEVRQDREAPVAPDGPQLRIVRD